MPKCYVQLNTNNRVVPLGAYSKAKVTSLLKNKRQSPLYRELKSLKEKFYQNDYIESVTVTGTIQAEVRL